LWMKAVLTIIGLIMLFCALLVAAPIPWSQVLPVPAYIRALGAEPLLQWTTFAALLVLGAILVFVGASSPTKKER
jgi:hypothetical protein